MFSILTIFDLDHTLLKGNSSFHFGKFLYRKKVFSTFLMLKMASIYLLHRLGFLSLNSLHQKLFSLLFKGQKSQLFVQEAELFFNAHLPSLLNPVLERELKRAQEESHYVAILSSSPDFLVEGISKRLQVHSYRATPYCSDQSQRFSHISAVIDGTQKRAIVQDLAQKMNIPMKQVVVYTDSYLDLPLLNEAGRPVAVNPDKRLRKTCFQKGWEMIDTI